MKSFPNPQKKTPAHRLKPYGLAQRINTHTDWPLDEQAAAWLLCSTEQVGYWAERTLTGLTITKKETEWLLTLKADNKGRPEVMFSSGDSLADAVKNAARALVSDQASWRLDRFKPKA